MKYVQSVYGGETPRAFIAPKKGAVVSKEEIITFCREHLAGYKIPKTIVLGPLPKTSIGKIQKLLLREQMEDTWE